MNTIDRKTAAEHLKKGWPVIYAGNVLAPVPLTDGTHAVPRDFPKAPADHEPPGRFVATRHANGQFTRAGLEAVIATGGSVLHNGKVIETIDKLPDETELAAGDQQRLDAVEGEIDRKIAELHAQRASVERERQRAEPPTPPQSHAVAPVAPTKGKKE